MKTNDNNQMSMFENLGVDNDWREEWHDMPEFCVPTRNTPLRNSYDVSDVVEENSRDTSIFPKYPVYIISKGRWSNGTTYKSLDSMNIPYRIVVEPQEYNNYMAVISPERILVLPFGNLGQGSIPARNWVWEHSISEGHTHHWILDDNINGFGTQKYGRRINTRNGNFFRECERFIDRYSNVAISGIRYRFQHNYVKTPYYLNTRIYSCILIRNDIPFRWRGTYNEDTDLSLRVLKDRWCTVLFIFCYCNKAGTMSMEGGNTDELYKDDGRLKMAQSLQEQHPDIVTVSRIYDRWQHKVDYQPFKKNTLIRKNDAYVTAHKLPNPLNFP